MKFFHFIKLFGIFLCPISLFGQVEGISKSEEILIEIENLAKDKKNIIKINNLVNDNSFIPPKERFEILNQNLSIATKNKDYHALSDTHLKLGNFWFLNGYNVKAYDNYLKSESISRKINDSMRLGITMMNKANLIHDKQTKIKFQNDAIEVFSKLKDTLNLARAHLNLGLSYISHIETDSEKKQNPKEILHFKQKAFRHYEIADSLNQHLNNHEIAGVINSYYGEWYAFNKEYEKVKHYYKKAENHIKQTGNIKGHVNCMIQLSQIYIQEKNYQNAFELLKQAEEISSKYNLKDYLVRIYNEISQLFAKQNDVENSFKYYKLYASNAIELNTIVSQDKIQIISLEHNLSENKLKLEQYQTQINLNRIVILLSVLIALLVSTISFYIIQNKRRKIENLEKNKIITEIELRNQQLEDKLLKEKISFAQNHLLTTANLSNKILNFLDELKVQVKGLNHNSTYQHGINELKISFSKILNDKSYLTELNTLSSELNQNFFIYLRKNHPKITKKDEQLLSFIILNIPTKEIAKMLHISIESVYTKRHRLRKKLNLKNDDSISGFYEKIISENMV